MVVDGVGVVVGDREGRWSVNAVLGMRGRSGRDGGGAIVVTVLPWWLGMTESVGGRSLSVIGMCGRWRDC